MLRMRAVTGDPITWEDVAVMQRHATRISSGALASFIGVVRADKRGHRVVQALEYEGYPDMVQPQIDRWFQEAHNQWDLTTIQIRYRLGLVSVGEISVVVIVAASHRRDAFAACRFIVERIKHDAPIWKREWFDDGTTQWSQCDEHHDPVHADV